MCRDPEHDCPTYRVDVPIGGPAIVMKLFGHTILVVAHSSLDALEMVNRWTIQNPDDPVGICNLPSMLASAVVTEPFSNADVPRKGDSETLAP